LFVVFFEKLLGECTRLGTGKSRVDGRFTRSISLRSLAKFADWNARYVERAKPGEERACSWVMSRLGPDGDGVGPGQVKVGNKDVMRLDDEVKITVAQKPSSHPK
jgi:hypothetical protein